jgi:outer membrane protein OmpA-like peptidoglycan-associated protein
MAVLMIMSVVPASAGEQTIFSVQYPPNTGVKLTLSPSTEAPAAQMNARVHLKGDQAMVELSWADLKPALLFGGDVTCYVLWAVTPGGNAANLGEVPSGSPKGSQQYGTRLKSFGLMVTAEAYAQGWQPSELVMFVNDTPDKKGIAVKTFNYSAFATAPDHDLSTIRTVAWDDSRPVELVQAERAFAYAGEMGAEGYAPAMIQDARLLLAQASNLVASPRRRSDGIDFARRSFGVTSNAIGEASRKIEQERLDAEIASRSEQVAAMEARAADAEASLAEAETERQQLESAMSALRVEQEALGSALTSMRAEKAELSNRLEDALSLVADTQNSARGMIVNLPDILFDVNESTLKPDATLVIAKLAGILLIMEDLNLRIEGHTDSSGSYDYNMRLSDSRARSVFDFLAAQGIDPGRMAVKGYGPDKPIADNSTSTGRGQNRRVEIVIAEGTIAEG